MTRVISATKIKVETAADLLRQLGDISPERVLLQPPPGTAKEKDVIAALESPQKRLCELVDGTLVEKPMGTREAQLAILLGYLIQTFLEEHDIGALVGADGPFRLRLGLVRMPDLAFVSWDRLPEGELPDKPIAPVIPDLAVEVLSKGNTQKEIERKLREYFRAGVRLAWVIQPRTQTATVYTSATEDHPVAKDGALDGGEVLPGFKLRLQDLFARTRRRRKGR